MAEAIIPFIVAIAGPLDMAVRLLHVLDPIPMIGRRSTWRRVRPTFHGRGVNALWEVRRGAPATIVGGAKSFGADLIAMTTHGRSGLGRLVFGSVAEQVLRHADVPVFVMRQTEAQVAARAAKEMTR